MTDKNQKTQMRKSIFGVDGDNFAVQGYSSGEIWNGWATPHFERDDIEMWLKKSDLKYQYDANTDTITVWLSEEDDQEGNPFQGQDILTEDGIKHLYPVGAWYWTWVDFMKKQVPTTEYQIL